MSFRRVAHRVASGLSPVVEWAWRLPIALLGRAMAPRAERWSTRGGARVLVVAPHPDDEVMGCAGVILRHVTAADAVCVAIATDGRQSRALHDPTAMAALRQVEARRAAELLGAARLEWLGLPEGEWRQEDLAVALERVLDDWRPDILYAPSCVDFHPEHVAVARTLAGSLAKLAPERRPRSVRVYQVQVPLTARLVNLVADVSQVNLRSEAARAAYASQAVSLASAGRQRRYAASVHGNASALEEFWELTTEGYVRLHLEPAPVGASFRGLRRYPLSDPLAYLVGGAGRQRLKDLGTPTHTASQPRP
jgi:LmbE family N-acetylglucosaminyl deacetylase